MKYQSVVLAAMQYQSVVLPAMQYPVLPAVQYLIRRITCNEMPNLSYYLQCNKMQYPMLSAIYTTLSDCCTTCNTVNLSYL